MSDVGGMVDNLIAAGCEPGVAARIVAEAFTAGVLSAPVRRQSADESADRRREKDAARKREQRALAKMSADNPQTSAESADCPKQALSLLEDNKKEKKERARKHPCPPTWEPNEKHFTWAEQEHIPRSAVLSKAEDMKLWAQSTGEQKKDWDATLFVWMRRDAAKLRIVPAGASVIPNEFSIQHFQRSGRWNTAYGPEPGKAGCRAPAELLQKYGYGERTDDRTGGSQTAEVA